MTSQIANFLQETLDAEGVAVVVEGAHMCSIMRGVKKAQASMTTRTLLGSFKEDQNLRGEFLSLVAKTSALD
jgi:GTP cyclohydrolase I